jgi:predicted metalloprotease with PDZ domain
MLLLMSLINLTTHAQSLSARISVLSLSPPRIKVEAERAGGTKIWSFRNAYAGINGLGDRIERVSLSNAHGSEIGIRKLASGEYEGAREATIIRYEVKLDPSLDTNAAAHASWLTAVRGLLMPGDLLPQPLARLRLSLTLPAQWKTATLETQNGAGQYEIEDADLAVFFVGADVRVEENSVRHMAVKFATAGEWGFADQEVISIIRDILEKHERTIGGVAQKSVLILLAPFPQTADASRWSAETRGGTVIFLSGRSTSKTAGLARLSVPLAHELLHLWVPNGLALSGDYDWFYEGFTVYQSMRVSVQLGYLTFQDFLDSLARAYDSYLTQRERDNLSLVAASVQRWGGRNELIYQKGMLVAALYDLYVRQNSRGKRSLSDVYRSLFRLNQMSGERREGNATVIDALDRVAGGNQFSKQYITTVSPLDLTTLLETFGLKVRRNGARTQITVSNSLSRSQSDLLRQLGYN